MPIHGQRATDSSLPWGVDALWRQLEPLLPGLSVEVVGRIGSTNSVLLDRARVMVAERPSVPQPAQHPVQHPGDGVQVRRSMESRAFGRRAVDLQPCLLVAENQTAGRGRLGRPWQAMAGGSLTFSLAVPLQRPDLSGLSLAVGVALADALDPSPDLPEGDVAPGRRRLRIGIKWPNDLWLLDPPPGGSSDAPSDAPFDALFDVSRRTAPGAPGAPGAPTPDGPPRRVGRKLGGVLLEATGTGAKRMVVIGVGLNVLPMPTPDVATTGFACLKEVHPAITVQQTLGMVALPLAQALQRFDQTGFATFAPMFAARDLLFRRPVVTTLRDPATGAPLRGEAHGVLPDGALCVLAADGQHLVRGGEVSVRLEIDHHHEDGPDEPVDSGPADLA